MTDPKTKEKKQIKTRPPGKLTGAGMFDRVKLRDEPHPMARFLVPQQPAESPPPIDSATAGDALTPGSTPAPGSQFAPASQTAPGAEVAPGRRPAPATVDTPGTKSAPGKSPAPGRRTAPGSKSAPASDAAPKRDFTRTPNSLLRDVLSRGLFPGKSRDIYDYLFSRTRGAIVPTVSALLTTTEIKRGAHIGSDHTLRDNLRHLRLLGLVEWKVNSGSQEGNLYTVLLPEEADLPFDREGNPLHVGSRGQSEGPRQEGQNLPGAPGAESARGVTGLTVGGAGGSGDPKTFIKTVDRADDEAAPALARLLKLERELTGKNSASAPQWLELVDVLEAELRIAAGRTTVSSVPAFLAEHLRRRLWKKEKRQIDAEAVAQQSSQKSQVDASKCPDCFGAGMYYPEGFEKGVARCEHRGLVAAEGD